VQDVQVIRFCAMLEERALTSIQQCKGNFSVPICNYDTEAHSIR
jgi:hypothetical protein